MLWLINTLLQERHNIHYNGFWKQHSTETALLWVSNDVLMSSDAGNSSVSALLSTYQPQYPD